MLREQALQQLQTLPHEHSPRDYTVTALVWKDQAEVTATVRATSLRRADLLAQIQFPHSLSLRVEPA